MNREKLLDLYKKYELTKDDVYKHQHYVIITRQGIEKIQASENIIINYDVIKCETNFAVFKANARIGAQGSTAKIETFGSALKGGSFKDGNCNTWYVAEMAEKRALSRAVLKLTGFYELGVFGEDESEDFKKKIKTIKQ
tara:strand:- start:612 stop:1028 length:417 start_codon:yes stop_codon:yes gene_type:complete